MTSVAIIGGGFCGMASAIRLSKDSSLDVTVFDYSFGNIVNTMEQINDIGFEGNSAPQGHRVLGSPGGLLVWGSMISSCLWNPSKWPITLVENFSSYAEFLQELGFPKMKLRGLENKRSIQVPLRSAYKNKIYGRFTALLKGGQVRCKSSQVTKIEPSGNGYLLHLSNQGEIVYFDKILITSGHLGSIKLLHDSGLINGELSLFNHPSLDLGSFPLQKSINLNMRKKSNHYTVGKTPNLWVTRDVENDLLISIRINPIFAPLRSLNDIFLRILRGERKFHSVNINLSIDLSKPFISFFPSNSNGKSHVTTYKCEGVQISKECINGIYLYLANLPDVYGQLGVVEIPNYLPFQLMTPSSHFMGSHLDGPSKVLLGEDFNLLEQKGIFVGSSASFPESVPGHPTYLAMISALHACNAITRS